MRLIQVILLAGLAMAFIVYLRFLRSSLRDRVLAVTFFGVAGVAILIPDLTQRVANFVGVGRGTDLTFYLFAQGFVFFAVLIYSKTTRQSRALTEVIRHLAIVESELQEQQRTGPVAPPTEPLTSQPHPHAG